MIIIKIKIIGFEQIKLFSFFLQKFFFFFVVFVSNSSINLKEMKLLNEIIELNKNEFVNIKNLCIYKK